MSDTIFRYSPEIDKKINTSVEKILSTNVLNVSKINQGEVNHVYKVTTEKESTVVRVFRRPHWPEDGKLPWIEEQLTKHNIPHAKTLYYSRDETYFPYGLMISKFVEGKNGADAIYDGDITFESFHEKLAQLLKKIHQVTINEFGQVNYGKGLVDDYIGYRLHEITNRLDQLTDDTDFDDSVKQKIQEVVRANLTPIIDKLKPVLVHGDPTPDNTIYTPDGNIILVDWDGAISDVWLWDYAWMTYWGSHLSKFGDIEERRQKLRESFINGYNQTELTLTEISKVEKALQICISSDLLPYYYLDNKNPGAYEKTKSKLNSLLSRFS